jgi:hypothetical protein
MDDEGGESLERRLTCCWCAQKEVVAVDRTDISERSGCSDAEMNLACTNTQTRNTATTRG